VALTVVVLQAAEDPTMAREEARITFDAAVVRVGRGEGADVRLPDLSVSPSHVRIESRGGGSYVLIDEGSENGTFVGEHPLHAGAEHLVTARTLLRVGRVWVELHPGTNAAPDPPGSTLALQLIEKAVARVSAGPRDRPCVVVRTGQPSRKTQWLLSDARRGVTYVIGRGNEAHVQLDEPNASRRHAQFVVRAESELWVRDLGSSNGTTLGGRRLEPGVDEPWPPGVELRVGASSLVYRHPWREALIELEKQATEPLEAFPERASTPPSPASEGPPAVAPAAPEAVSDEGHATQAVPPPETGLGRDAPIAMVPELRERSGVRVGGPSRVQEVAIALLAFVVLAFCGLGVWLLVAG
jgi:pSer/pThr/pTyr-binding forkhead associated (FHA) protein